MTDSGVPRIAFWGKLFGDPKILEIRSAISKLWRNISFRRFGLKIPSHAPFFGGGVDGVLSLNRDQYQRDLTLECP